MKGHSHFPRLGLSTVLLTVISATVALARGQSCAPVPGGLVSWWRAEGNALDGWGFNDGIPVTAPAYGDGKVGRAFLVQRGIYVNDATSLHFTNALTIEAWANPSRFPGASPQTIVSKYESSVLVPNGTNSSFYLGIATNARPIFMVSANGSPRANAAIVAGEPLPTNQWSFIVATYDGSAIRLYVNGSLTAQSNYSAGIFPGTANLGIGFIPNAGSFSAPFSALLDEVALYNRSLTDGEIQAIYNADLIGKCVLPPSITEQPRSQDVPQGEDVRFTVGALGSCPLKYQWRLNGQVIQGATNPTLVLEELKTNQAGFYNVSVTNSAGYAISARAQLTLLSPPGCTTTPAGLISWWPADGNTGDVMGINPFSFASLSYVTGKVDRAFSFFGSANYWGQVSDSASLNFGSNADFTIEAWIKPAPTNAVFANVPMIEKRTVVGQSGAGYSLSLHTGRLAFWMGTTPLNPEATTNASMFVSSGPNLRDGLWHHVAVAIDRTATNGGRLFVDGQNVLTFDPTPFRGSLINPSAMRIGRPTSALSNSSYAGLMDELAIYNRALSAAEILAIRNAGAAGRCKIPPSILVQPISQRVTAGSNATFTVTTAGSPLLRYQWLRHGQALSGATNSVYTITNVSTRSSPGSYSCRVTNLFGSATSSNAVLTVNSIPVARGGGALSLNEDTSIPITLLGFDEDRDSLTYVIAAPPAHGILSGSGSNRVYTPAPDYNGPDSFSYKVNDGLVDSAPASYTITVLPVNDPPVALPQSVVLDEDTAIAITLAAFDVDGDALAFSVGAPSHGTPTGTPPGLSYRPHTNYYGPDSFTFSVSDGQTNSAPATVTITVRPVNDAPFAKISVSPLAEFTGITNQINLAPVGGDAKVVLDGSQSSDVENDPLEYFWSEVTNTFASGVKVTNEFAPGTHTVTLTVSDGEATGTAITEFDVLTPAEVVGLLIAAIEDSDLGRRNVTPLIASLRNAAKSFEKGNATAGINQLQAFQHKVRAQVAPAHPALAEEWISEGQQIIDAAENADTGPAAKRSDAEHGADRGPGGVTGIARDAHAN